MKKSILGTICIVCLSLSTDAQSIKDLDFLIGSWEIVETIFPGTDREYQEKGTRTCSYVFNGSFIKCESSTTISKNNKTRVYAYFINYDKKEDCYWATSFASDFPKHGLHKWFLDRENQQIIAINPKNVIEDRFFRGTISYKNRDQLIWNGWSSKFLDDKEWTQTFNDVATKK